MHSCSEKLHRDHVVLVVLVVRSEVRKHGHYIIETKVNWVTFSFHSSGIIFTVRNEVLAKVIFLHLFVILFTGGEYLTRYPPGPGTSPRPGTPPGPGTPPRTRYTPQTRYTPPGCKLRNTVNDRPVRILLECILV